MITLARLELVVNKSSSVKLEVSRSGEDLYTVWRVSHGRRVKAYRRLFTEDAQGRVELGAVENHLMARCRIDGTLFYIQSTLGPTPGMLREWQRHLGTRWEVFESEDAALAEAATPLPMRRADYAI